LKESLFDILKFLVSCRFQIRESAKIASLKVKAKQENVSGVQLPAFDMIVDGGNGTIDSFFSKRARFSF
jgi:V-type H+-transporting ATPase subunit D